MKTESKVMMWEDVTIQQYMDIQNLISVKSDNAIEQYRQLILVLYNTDINDMNIIEAQNKIDEMNNFLQTKFEVKKEPKKLTIGDTKCIVCDLSTMTLGQFMDYQELSKNPNENLVELLALSIVPVGAKYNDGSYDISELKENIKKSSVTNLYGVLNFQLAKLKSQYRSSLAYLTVQIWLTKGKDKQMKKAMKTSLQMAYKSMGY